MSVQALTWVLDHSDATGTDRLVLIALANHASADGWEAWPSVASIATEAKVSERTAQYALRRLEGAGVITETLNTINRTRTRTWRINGTALPVQAAATRWEADADDDYSPEQPALPSPRVRAIPTYASDLIEALRAVPSWDHQLSQGADAGVIALIQQHPGIPWMDIAAVQAASRLDTTQGSLRTDSPIQALTLGMQRHRATVDRNRGAAAEPRHATADRHARQEAALHRLTGGELFPERTTA